MLKRRDFIKYLLLLGKSVFVFSLTGCSISRERKLQDDEFLSDISEDPTALSPQILTDIKKLASDSMQGRQAGTVGEIRAAKYITERMDSLGLSPLGETGYEHVFTIADYEKAVVNNRLVFKKGNSNALRTPSVNLIGKLPGKNKDKIILISAHYDHLGIYNNNIYPGANDNASGVACALDVVKRLQKEGTNSTIVLAFWSAEEMGFLGSKAFIKRPTFPINQIEAVFNIDTVGNGKTGEFDLWYADKNRAVKSLLKAAEIVKADVAVAPKSSHNSDQSSFADIGIPAVTLLSREWLIHNHSPQDTLDRINRQQINTASNIIYKAVKIADSANY